VGLLTDRITNKSEESNLINAHAPSREPVPLSSNNHFPRFRSSSNKGSLKLNGGFFVEQATCITYKGEQT